MILDFAVWAPNEQTFWDSWVAAGIVVVSDSGYVFTPEYPGISISSQTSQGWIPTTSGEKILGWHCNVRVDGPLVDQFTYQIDQYDENGNLKNIFDRTWATLIFQLEYRDADPTTGFPAGYQNGTGVCYCDPRDFKSPTNTWLK